MPPSKKSILFCIQWETEINVLENIFTDQFESQTLRTGIWSKSKKGNAERSGIGLVAVDFYRKQQRDGLVSWRSNGL